MTDGIKDLNLLTVPEAAKLLRIGRNLAYDLVARGEIPSVRLGRVIRVPRTALEQWLEAPSRASGQDGHGGSSRNPMYKSGANSDRAMPR